MRLFKGLFNNLPFQVNYFYSKSAQQAFDKFLESHVPQHVFCQLIRTAEYVRKYSVLHKSIDYMDAFSAGMRRMSKNARWPLSWIMGIEEARLRKYERGVYGMFSGHFIISRQDELLLGIEEKMEVISNGVAPELFSMPEEAAKKWDILFTGNMSYRPNVESARFLVQEIMPLVWKELPETKVCIAGATPTLSVLSLKQKNVEVTGWVENLATVYNQSRIFVAPMLINSGLQNKLLEAMASGLPTITTDLANNALGATQGEHVLTANDARGIANHVLELLSGSKTSDRLGKSGREFIRRNFSWKRSADLLEQRILQS